MTGKDREKEAEYERIVKAARRLRPVKRGGGSAESRAESTRLNEAAMHKHCHFLPSTDPK